MLPRSSRLALTIHRGPSGLAELREAWERLCAQHPTRFYGEWLWHEASLSSLETDPSSVLFAQVLDGATTVAIVPLKQDTIRQRGVVARRLRLPHYDHPPLADIVYQPGLAIDDVLDALSVGLRQAGITWDVLELGPVLDESVLAESPRRWAWRSVRQRVKTCDQVRGDEPWEDFAARLSPNFRSNLNKSRNKLAKEREVVYAMVTDLDEMRALLPPYMALEASGWKGEAGTSMGQDPRTAAFYRRVLDELGALGRVRINTLSIGGQYVAMQFCLVDGETLYIHKLAYDEGRSKLAPGNALLAHVIGARAFRYVNLEGSPPWFQQWKPEPLTFRGIECYFIVTKKTLKGADGCGSEDLNVFSPGQLFDHFIDNALAVLS